MRLEGSISMLQSSSITAQYILHPQIPEQNDRSMDRVTVPSEAFYELST